MSTSPNPSVPSPPITQPDAWLVGLEPQYRGFSNPYEAMDLQFLQMLARESARHVVDRFLGARMAIVDARASGLTGYLRDWISLDLIPEATSRDPAFGDIFRTTTDATDAEVLISAAAVAARLAAAGIAGQWACSHATPFRFRWENLLLPPCDSIAVSAEEMSASVRLSLAGKHRRLELARISDDWQARPNDEVVSLPRVGMPTQRIRLLPRHAVVLKEFQNLVESAVEVIDVARYDRVQRAFEYIERFAPTFTPWINRVLTDIFLLEPKSSLIESGSVESYFGFIHLSAFERVTPIAELLVHESSHQYFHVLWRISSYDDGSDTQVYWSPPVQRYRDVSRIMAAYHAFGNILLFYRECLENGADDDNYFRTNVSRVTEELRQLEAPLRNNPALTTMGRALCEPLMKRLALS